ncbi:proline-rich receptor-like protein kinase PERK2 [Diplogelasinospora grovesii]|uniref:Proline-rich receptor-like protein kinase PERK2 n=1 Tax=Diplogelasinospora grovesii TaxID=303347 RepID=A0AAN6N4V5_9PEZI|nr:proline-rich receptor-like protein kinase PERK2 [Diplogelasinospora grovesii]
MSSTAVLVGQAPTNLGPLTTTFTPPAVCTVAVGAATTDGGLLGLGLLGGSSAIGDIARLGQTCSAGGTAVDAAACWPPTSKGAATGNGFYSPGLDCPVGYATACSATGGSGGSSGWPVQFKLLDGETAVGCCPNGYGCANVNGQTCLTVATSTTVPTVTCDGTKVGAVVTQTVPDVKASITAMSLFAPMIQINWQSSDRPQETASSSSALTSTGVPVPVAANGTQSESSTTSLPQTQSPTTTAAAELPATGTTDTLIIATASNSAADPASSAQTDQQKQDASTASSGLPTSTKVGISVAGGVAAIVAVASALIYVWRRRRNQREEQELDRLYGVKHVSSSSSLTGHDSEIPGWYRGQRQMAPTADPSRPVPDAQRYYRPYRP